MDVYGFNLLGFNQKHVNVNCLSGVKVMFRVALVLVKSVLGTSEQLSKCPTFYETLDRLRKIPAEYMEENYLAGEVRLLQLADVNK